MNTARMLSKPIVAKCRRCQIPHRVEEYRGVRYMVCPAFNRVLLVNEGIDEQKPVHSEAP